jgi:hypothetical protein
MALVASLNCSRCSNLRFVLKRRAARALHRTAFLVTVPLAQNSVPTDKSRSPARFLSLRDATGLAGSDGHRIGHHRTVGRAL